MSRLCTRSKWFEGNVELLACQFHGCRTSQALGLSHELFKSSICNSRLAGKSSGIGYG